MDQFAKAGGFARSYVIESFVIMAMNRTAAAMREAHVLAQAEATPEQITHLLRERMLAEGGHAAPAVEGKEDRT